MWLSPINPLGQTVVSCQFILFFDVWLVCFCLAHYSSFTIAHRVEVLFEPLLNDQYWDGGNWKPKISDLV